MKGKSNLPEIKDSIVANDNSSINKATLNKSKINNFHKESFFSGLAIGIVSSLIATIIWELFLKKL